MTVASVRVMQVAVRALAAPLVTALATRVMTFVVKQA
jgi:hypothetical protein